MKKVSLLILSIGLTFGLAAQGQLERASFTKTQNPEKTTTFKTAELGQVKEISLPRDTKTASLTLSEITLSSETDSGFNATFTVTMGTDCEKYSAVLFGEDCSGYSDAALIDYFEYMNWLYSMYGVEYYDTVSKSPTYIKIPGLSQLQVIAIAINGVDTTIVRSPLVTVPSSAKNGTAQVEITADVTEDGYSVDITFAKNDQTMYYYYWINTASSDQQLGFDGTVNGIPEYMDSLSSWGYEYQLYNDINDIIEALDSNDNPIAGVWNVMTLPYNGNAQVGTPSLVQFTINGSSLKDVNIANVSVYPNPASDYVTVSSLQKVNNVEIVNTLGQVVYSDNTAANGYNINVKNFERGTYFVKVRTNGKVSTSKIIVK